MEKEPVACHKCGRYYRADKLKQCPGCAAAATVTQVSPTDSRAYTPEPKPKIIVSSHQSIPAARVAEMQSKLIERYMFGVQAFGIVFGVIVASIGLIKGPNIGVKFVSIIAGILLTFFIYVNAALTRMVAAYINFNSLVYLEENQSK